MHVHWNARLVPRPVGELANDSTGTQSDTCDVRRNDARRILQPLATQVHRSVTFCDVLVSWPSDLSYNAAFLPTQSVQHMVKSRGKVIHISRAGNRSSESEELDGIMMYGSGLRRRRTFRRFLF